MPVFFVAWEHDSSGNLISWKKHELGVRRPELLCFLNKNIERLNRKSDVYANELIESGISYFKSYSADVLTTALPRCNLAYKRGIDNVESISSYYDSCDKYNATFNGLRPNENFYNK